MAAQDNLNGMQFPTADRVAAFKSAKPVPGREAPVFFANDKHQYVDNPLQSHLASGTGILPGYDENAFWERKPRIQSLPVDRLESGQAMVSRNHVNNMVKRKGTPPPIEVTHHVDLDRYEVTEGNHRALRAMLKGETHVEAEVIRRFDGYDSWRTKRGY